MGVTGKRLSEIDDQIRKLTAERERLEAMPQKTFDPNGTWKVTTEGDCEGKTVKSLGVHDGNIFDIANALRSMSFYGLSFKRVAPKEDVALSPDHKGSVNITIHDEAIVMFDKDDHIAQLTKVAPPNVKMKASNYYGYVELAWK